jgi:hypothetical protein
MSDASAPAADSGDLMTVDEARTYVRQFAQNAGDSSVYSVADIDRAILTVGEDFVRITRCIPATATVALAEGSADVDLSDIDNFRPTRLSRAWIDDYPALSIQDIQTVRYRRNCSDASGRPTTIGFSSWTAGQVWPRPDADYTLNLAWFAPFTTWTPGISQSVAQETTINLPADWLRQVLATGVPAMLQMHENEHPYTGPAWQQYLQLRSEVRGMGSLGAKVVYRMLDR